MRRSQFEYLERIFSIARESDESKRNQIAFETVKVLRPKMLTHSYRFVDYALFFFAGIISSKLLEVWL